ncbi:hypothetical protein [Hydrogenophaga sp.]|uniref:hypothetical protein n=1 Tax=Hydrogenophaga sp. TaxID=1904254 RepID=UPI003D145597
MQSKPGALTAWTPIELGMLLVAMAELHSERPLPSMANGRSLPAAVVQQDCFSDRFRRGLVAFVGILRIMGEKQRAARLNGACGGTTPG